MCNSVSITTCTNKLKESVWGVPFEPHWWIPLLGFKRQDNSKLSTCRCSTNGTLMTFSWFSLPGQKVDTSSTQSNNYIQSWHSPVNLKTQLNILWCLCWAPQFWSKLRSIINLHLLDHTHGGGRFTFSDTKWI